MADNSTIRVLNNKTGQSGSIDIKDSLAQQGLELTEFNPDTLEAKVKDPVSGRTGSVNVAQGAGLQGKEDIVVDSSPLTAMERVQLGMVKKDATVYGQYLQKAKAVLGGTAIPGQKEFDAQAPVQEGRALNFLKKKFEDARVVNGNFQVKQNGVWKMADSNNSSLADYGKDIAEFVGNSGLNIMGAIAGATYGAGVGSFGGPIGTIIGGVLGSVAGSVVGEVAEEGTAIGISDGVIDPNVIGNELITEATLGLAGELPFAKLGAKLAAKAASRGLAANSEEIIKEGMQIAVAKNQRGFTKISKEASPGVKDSIAKIYSTANANISQPALRTAIDSPENMAEVIQHSKTIANLGPNDPNPVLNDMGDIIQDGLMKVYKSAQKDYGETLNKVQFALNGTKFETNLSELSKYADQQLSQISDDAGGYIRPLLRVLKSEVAGEKAARTVNKAEVATTNTGARMLDLAGTSAAEVSTKAGAKENDVILKGGIAFNKLRELNKVIDDRLESLGAYKADINKSNAANEAISALEKIKAQVDEHITAATKYVDLGPKFEAQKVQYGELKDSFKKIWGRAFSATRDTDFAQRVAKDTVDLDKSEALKTINKLRPEFNYDKITRDLRVRQAAIETKDAFAFPKSGPAFTAAVAGAGAFLTSHPLIGAPVVAAAISPKAALKMASKSTQLAATAQNVGKVARIPMDQAKQAARKLVIMANTSGVIHAMPAAQKQLLLKDKNLFDKYFNGTGDLTKEVDGAQQRIIDAASQAAEQKQGQ